MPVMDTLSAAFSYFNDAKAANPRWGWAAQSADGRTVVLTMWRDEIVKDGNTLIYSAARIQESGDGVRRWKQGARDRMNKLQHARDHCGGEFRAVIIEKAEATKRGHRTRSKYLADENLVMKLEFLNTESGAFKARSLSPRAFRRTLP